MLRLLLGVATGQAAQRASDAMRRIALMAAAGVVLLVALGFVTAAAFIATAQHWGSLIAALVFGAGFLVLALILMVLAGQTGRRDRRLMRMEAEARQAQAQAMAALATVPEAIARRPMAPLLAAFAGGLLLAMRLRR